MARRNDRSMRKTLLLIMAIGVLTCSNGVAQNDTNLKKMTDDLLQLRKTKASNEVLNKIVLDWSASGNPKITLMDEIKRDKENEFRGNGANKFKLNQVVTHVYNRQNTGMVSKGDFFNSTEEGINYSAIEKTVKKGGTVNYTLTGHIGVQEFVFISYNAEAKFAATVNDQKAQQIAGKKGVLWLRLPKVKKEDKFVISISNHSGANESFVILNYNPQK